MNQYKIHNPFFELISTREGSVREEMILHLYLELLGFKADFLNEWFIEDAQIYQIFHKKINTVILRRLWKGRDSLFKQEDFNNPLKGKLFKELREKFWKGNYKYQIDNQWKSQTSKSLLKKMKGKSIDEILEEMEL